MDLIEKASKLIQTATVDDIEKINNILWEMLPLRAQYELLSAEQELNYEKLRAEEYIRLRRITKESKSSMTQADCVSESKRIAMEKYWEYYLTKANKNIYKNTMDKLASKKPELLWAQKMQPN